MKRILIIMAAFLMSGCVSNMSEQDALETWQWNNSNFGGLNSVGIKGQSVTTNAVPITKVSSQKTD